MPCMNFYQADPAGQAALPAAGEQPTLGPSPEHFELMRSALDHIARTARKSRTSTRRLRWIEHRAEMAIKGEAYSDAAFDLPKDAGPNTAEKLKWRVASLTAQRDELFATLQRIADPRNTHFAGDAQVVARAAIAKATGGAA